MTLELRLEINQGLEKSDRRQENTHGIKSSVLQDVVIHTQLKFENFEAPGERKCQFHHVKSTLNLNPVAQKPLQWQHWYQRDGEKSQKRGNPSQERQRRSNRETGPKKSRQKGTFFIFVFVTHTHAREQSPATSRNYPRKL